MAGWRQAADAINKLLADKLESSIYPSTKVFIGWPDPQTVLDDLRDPEPRALISIFPDAGSTFASRYWKEPSLFLYGATETTRIESDGLTVTLGGTLSVGDNIFIYVNGMGFSATVSPSSSLSTLATQLATLITSSSCGVSATATSNQVVLSSFPKKLSARAFGHGTSFYEVLRVNRRMMISAWTANEIHRDQLQELITITLSDAEFLTFADSSLGRILYDSSRINDFGMPAGILKHDIFYTVEYGVFSTKVLPRVGDVHCIEEPLTPDGTLTQSIDFEIF
jgi:hypothetical protein